MGLPIAVRNRFPPPARPKAVRFRKILGPAALFGLLLLVLTHLSALAVMAIGGYRAHIAPALGIHCGYARAMGAESCSAYASRILAERGMLRGLPLALARFRACGALRKGKTAWNDRSTAFASP